jgi:hypothetical protein
MLLWIIAIGMIVILSFFFMFRKKKDVVTEYKFTTFDEFLVSVSMFLAERLYISDASITSHEQFQNQIDEKFLFKELLEKARQGDYKSRLAVIEEIASFLAADQFHLEELSDIQCVMFDDPERMTSHEKFETMLYLLRQEHLNDPNRDTNPDNMEDRMMVKRFLEIAGTLELKRPLKTQPNHQGYYIDAEDMATIFNVFMDSRNYVLTLQESLDITALLIYQRLLGYDVLDTLIYDESIDQMTIGASGSSNTSKSRISSPENSILVMIDNKLIRFQFLSFTTADRLKRAIAALASNGDETFTPRDGYKFTTLKILRRVTVYREPTTHHIGASIRRLAIAPVTNKQLLDKNPRPIKNTQMVQDHLQIMAWGLAAIAFSGTQGSGKTSHINAFFDLLEVDNAIRAFGNIDETHFGDRYPERDCIHFFETINSTLHEVAAVGRRSNGMFFALMEVINTMHGIEAINNLKSGYVGGILSTHGQDAKAVVEFLAGLLPTSSSKTDNIMTVTSCINFVIKTFKYGDIFGYDGIDEIIPREWNIPWETFHPENSQDYELLRAIDFSKFGTLPDPQEVEIKRAANEQYYQQNVVDPKLFDVRRIINFNKETLEYEVVNRFTPQMTFFLFMRLGVERRKFFYDVMMEYHNVSIIDEFINYGYIHESNRVMFSRGLES